MRTNEERIVAMHKRALQLEYEKRKRTAIISYIGAAIVTVAAMVLLTVVVPGLPTNLDLVSQNMGMNGSVFSDSNMLNYIIVGLGAFLLGIAVTIFCYKINQMQKSGASNDASLKNEVSDADKSKNDGKQ